MANSVLNHAESKAIQDALEISPSHDSHESGSQVYGNRKTASGGRSSAGTGCESGFHGGKVMRHPAKK